jgi:hypothetical protein
MPSNRNNPNYLIPSAQLEAAVLARHKSLLKKNQDMYVSLANRLALGKIGLDEVEAAIYRSNKETYSALNKTADVSLLGIDDSDMKDSAREIAKVFVGNFQRGELRDQVSAVRMGKELAKSMVSKLVGGFKKNPLPKQRKWEIGYTWQGKKLFKTVTADDHATASRHADGILRKHPSAKIQHVKLLTTQAEQRKATQDAIKFFDKKNPITSTPLMGSFVGVSMAQAKRKLKEIERSNADRKKRGQSPIYTQPSIRELRAGEFEASGVHESRRDGNYVVDVDYVEKRNPISATNRGANYYSLLTKNGWSQKGQPVKGASERWTDSNGITIDLWVNDSTGEVSWFEMRPAHGRVVSHEGSSSSHLFQLLKDDRAMPNPRLYSRSSKQITKNRRTLGSKKSKSKSNPGLLDNVKQFFNSALELGQPKDTQSAADAVSEMFHGRPVKERLMIKEKVFTHNHYAELGKMISMKVRTLFGQLIEIGFETTVRKNQVILSADPEARSLYLIGGDQSIDLKSFKLPKEAADKDHVLLGVLDEITYQTEKEFDNFETIHYYHKAGEDSGVQPVLSYDTHNKKLSIIGGAYVIESRGIVD